MPEEYRVTIRLTPDLYAQLEASGSQWQTWQSNPRHRPVPRGADASSPRARCGRCAISTCAASRCRR
jgi:hypothetical protein